MKKILLPVLCLLLTACASKLENVKVDELPANSAFIALDVDFTFDHKKQESCFLGVYAIDNDQDIAIQAVDNYRLRIASVPGAGRYSFDSVMCMEHKIFFNKTRIKRLNPPLTVNVQAGTITYPGTVVADWRSESFGVLDTLSLGGASEDTGTLTMRREDRSAQVQLLLEKKNPAWLRKFMFVTTTFEHNPLIAQ